MPAARTIPVEERLFSLVLALLATEHGLTKHDILSTVTGYAARYAAERDHGSLERQFERDKEELRDLGVPLETFDAQGAENDTKFQRYRIPADRYHLPEEVRFTADQYALLGLAAQVWREGSLSQDSRRALTKLRSLGLTLDEAVIGVAPTIRTRDSAHEPLTLAIDRGHQVTFPYLKPGQSNPELRRVSPLALVHHEGRWHLHAHDDTVDAPRTFLLRRIVGQVVTAGAATRRPAADEPAQALASLREIWQRTVAIVQPRPGSEADVVLRNRGDTRALEDSLEVHTTDLDILADELAAFGADVVVREPASLRDAVRERWERVAVTHG